MKVDHGKLDAMLGKVLDAYKSGEVSRSSAIGAIAHVVAAVEKGNEAEVVSWLGDKGTFERWLETAKTA